MPTDKQILGHKGEWLVIKSCICPKCKKEKTLKLLRQNFKCADIICDFCGYLAQVKSKTSKSIDKLPNTIIGAAWGVQKDRLESGIFMPLFIVLYKSDTEYGIYYLSADLQVPGMFIPRNPLRDTAQRHGWQGFIYDITKLRPGSIVRLI
ncbi:MAG: hypothetical protein A2X24_12965 [Chloroflexi bacterium GWB2_54_36]|nr:MAG: hypothetical protein A2X24_12965 [Chloroflexi bacterium GWB2_54_36]